MGLPESICATVNGAHTATVIAADNHEMFATGYSVRQEPLNPVSRGGANCLQRVHGAVLL